MEQIVLFVEGLLFFWVVYDAAQLERKHGVEFISVATKVAIGFIGAALIATAITI